jgi:hypothetical protein
LPRVGRRKIVVPGRRPRLRVLASSTILRRPAGFGRALKSWRKSWPGPPRLSSKSASASRSTAIFRPNSDPELPATGLALRLRGAWAA